MPGPDAAGAIGDPIKFPFISSGCPPAMAKCSRWDCARFLRLQNIGSGFASTVYLALDTLSNTKVALKVYRKSQLTASLLETIRMEVSIHGRLVHPHILGLHATFEDADLICIVLSLAEDSDLYRRLPDIRRDERTVVKHIVGPLLSALGSMHLMGVLHRDLKPENVLLQGSHVFLADFGFAVCTSRHRPVTRLGTLHFMAPEVLLNDVRNRTSIREKVPRPRRAAYSAAVDVWALGVIVYECLLREPPFDGPSEAAAIDAILDDKPELDASVLSARAIDFLSLCLAYNSGDRPSTVSLYEHAWVKDNMPRDKWEQLHPNNFATVESALSSMEIMGPVIAALRAGQKGPGEIPPVAQRRRPAGSIAAGSDDGSREPNPVARRRAKATHSQFAGAVPHAAGAGVAVAVSMRTGSVTGERPHMGAGARGWGDADALDPATASASAHAQRRGNAAAPASNYAVEKSGGSVPALSWALQQAAASHHAADSSPSLSSGHGVAQATATSKPRVAGLPSDFRSGSGLGGPGRPLQRRGTADSEMVAAASTHGPARGTSSGHRRPSNLGRSNRAQSKVQVAPGAAPSRDMDGGARTRPVGTTARESMDASGGAAEQRQSAPGIPSSRVAPAPEGISPGAAAGVGPVRHTEGEGKTQDLDAAEDTRRGSTENGDGKTASASEPSLAKPKNRFRKAFASLFRRRMQCAH